MTAPGSRRPKSSSMSRPTAAPVEQSSRKRLAPSPQDNSSNLSKRVRRSSRNGSEDQVLSSEEKQLLFCYSLLFDPVRGVKRRLVSAKFSK